MLTSRMAQLALLTFSLGPFVAARADVVAGQCSTTGVCSGDVDAQVLASDLLVIGIATDDGTPPLTVNFSTDCSSCSFTSSGWTGIMSGDFAGGAWDGSLDGDVTVPDRVWKIKGSGTANAGAWSFQDSTITEFTDPADKKTKFNLDLTYKFKGKTINVTTPTPLVVTASDLEFEQVSGKTKFDDNGVVVDADFTFKLMYTEDLKGTIKSTATIPGNKVGFSDKGKFSLDSSSDLTITSVPEPSTWVPLGCFGVGTFLLRMRRRPLPRIKDVSA